MILITGGAGYIGSHTVINLLNNNYEVVIFDNLSTGHIETVNMLKSIGDIKFEQGDLFNIKDLENLFSKYDIEAVIHFAAFSLVEESCINPQKYYINNVIGTLNLLNTMLKYNVKKIVFSSTCATYGVPKTLPIDENHPQNPINPYGNTKLTVEGILKDYDKAYELKSIILRYFNVAGCDHLTRIGEWHIPETHLIPNILKSVTEKDKVFKIFGTDYDTKDGTCIRDYVNVEDLAEAHRLALEYLFKSNKSDIFNIGTEKGNTVKEIFDICKKITNTNIKVEETQRRAGDPPILYANAKKAKEILGWTPKKTIQESIETAWLWENKQIR